MACKADERPKRLRSGGNPYFGGCKRGHSGHGGRPAYPETARRPRTGGSVHHRSNGFRLLKDLKGFITVEFLIYFMIFVFLMFGAVDYYIVQTRHQLAEHIKEYYLDRISVEGYLTISDEEEMIEKFNDIGITVEEIDAPRQSKGDPPVLRDNSNPTGSEVWLKVTGTPKTKPFLLGRLFGASETVGSEAKISVGGRRLSERIEPPQEAGP